MAFLKKQPGSNTFIGIMDLFYSPQVIYFNIQDYSFYAHTNNYVAGSVGIRIKNKLLTNYYETSTPSNGIIKVKFFLKKKTYALFAAIWDSVLVEPSCSKAFDKFVSTLQLYIATCSKTIILPTRKLPLKPWIDIKMKKSIKLKNKLGRKSKRFLLNVKLKSRYLGLCKTKMGNRTI